MQTNQEHQTSPSNNELLSDRLEKKKSKRGFASMSEELRREIARKGGRTAHEKGVAHRFTPEEASAAGRKGGEAVSENREHMAAIGRKGGEARKKLQ